VVVAAVLAGAAIAAGDAATGAASETGAETGLDPAGAADTAGATAEGVPAARPAVELEPPPPPQATSVVPNTAIAVIRIAKFWSGRVMASSSRVTVGNKLLPQGILKGYAKAKLHNSKIKVAVHYFVQIQRNVVGSFTTIIRLESDYCVFM
jgi:hypothetical protein